MPSLDSELIDRKFNSDLERKKFYEFDFIFLDSTFVIVFDEAHELLHPDHHVSVYSKSEGTDPQEVVETINLFRAIRRALTEIFYDYKIIGCFVGTLSKLSNFHPEHVTSSRGLGSVDMENPLTLFNPFLEFPYFHQKGNPLPLKSDVLKKDLLDLFHLGRPLWSTIPTLPELVLLAQQKLLCMNDISKIETDAQYLALLSCRVGLQVSPREELASTLVEKHMAICSSISSDRKFVTTSYGVEPVLHEAACKLMVNVWPACLERIASLLLTKGFVEGGVRGELICRLFLLYTFDLCISDANCRYYHTPVSLSSFFLKLQIPKKKPLMNGHLILTHFIQLNFLPDENMLKLMYSLGAGGILPRNAHGADLIIPILLTGDEISFILIQVKNFQNLKFTGMNAAHKKLTLPYCFHADYKGSLHNFSRLFFRLIFQIGFKGYAVKDFNEGGYTSYAIAGLKNPNHQSSISSLLESMSETVKKTNWYFTHTCELPFGHDRFCPIDTSNPFFKSIWR